MLLIAEYVVPVSSEPIEHGAVFIKDGAIADIGDAEMMRLRYPNEEVKDFGMAALTPGFIDLHARMEDAVFRGLVHDLPFVQWRKEIAALRKRISYAEAFDSAFLGGLEALSSGVTTVADITSTGACVSAAQKLGLRGMFYREAEQSTSAWLTTPSRRLIATWKSGRRPSTPTASPWALRQIRCTNAIPSCIAVW